MLGRGHWEPFSVFSFIRGTFSLSFDALKHPGMARLLFTFVVLDQLLLGVCLSFTQTLSTSLQLSFDPDRGVVGIQVTAFLIRMAPLEEPPSYPVTLHKPAVFCLCLL